MAVVTVNSSQALTKAMQFASAGDIIKLAPGTYSGLSLQDLSFSKAVTITSADPNRAAVITDLRVKNCDGITFSNLDLTNTKNLNLPFQFMGCSGLKLDNLDVSGSSSSASAMNAQLMIIRGSSNIQVTNSDFGYGWHGLNLFNSQFITVQGNHFHDLRTDGVRGGGNSDLTIKSNVFTNFHPIANDHPDAIQLWTVNTSQSAANILIDSNVVTRGNGAPVQGIFIRDITGSLPFQNLIVSNNVITGGLFNGIAVSGVKNGYIADNIVQAFSDQPSGIQMNNATSVVFRDNEATRFFGGLRGVQGQLGNLLIPVATDQGVGIINYWLSQHPEFITAWKVIDSQILSLLQWNGSTSSGTISQTSSLMQASLAAAVTAVAADADSTGTSTNPATDVSAINDDMDAAADMSSGGAAPDSPVNVLRLEGHGTDGVGTDADNRIIGTDGADRIDGLGGDDVISGGSSDDDIKGGDGNDALHGEGGDDRLSGEAGDDLLRGQDGDDILNGGAGRDMVDGGRGADVLTGGADDDIFRFRVGETDKRDVDVITDFQSGADRIQITDIQFGSDPSQAQTFTFIGKSAFKGNAGEIRFFDTAAGVIVQADVDGDSAADFEFSLRGVHSLSVKDFIL